MKHAEKWLTGRWIPVAVNLGALALLSLGLAQGTWRLVTPAISESAPANVGPGSTGATDYNLQILLAANLFGRVTVAEPAKAEPALDAIPLSNLSLVLTGVMVTPAGSFALISADGGDESPFGIGDEITAGVTLHAVYADRALIRRGGATESLMLKETGQPLPGGAIARSRFSPPRVPGNTGGNTVLRNGQNNFTVDRDQLTQQMQTPEFLTQALMVPNAGGGFLVREIQPGSLYEKLGLRVGDVINSVNGQQVNSVEDVMQLYVQFGSASNVQVDVRRAGRSETLVYNLQ